MHVVATAGHVDHGKSTLIRALTGMEPDRWAEERRRGMTIDLGFAWTVLPDGAEMAFVDVPGHERFATNMLAGVGPAPAALLVVAADGGWSAQTTEHVAALAALGVARVVLAVTRSDLADPAPVLADSLARLEAAGLGPAEAAAVAAPDGRGLAELGAALGRLAASLPAPVTEGRLRLWVDRAFTVRGFGTVLTGTLGAGRLAVGDVLALGDETVTIRGLQTLGRPVDEVPAVARVAVNLRSVPRAQVRRGAALLTPAAWLRTALLDGRLQEGAPPGRQLPRQLVLHVGSAAVPVRVRALDERHVRLHLHTELPLQVGDRALLRDPGHRRVVGGLVVLDPAPPPLDARGAARDRAAALAAATGRPDLAGEVARRGVVDRRMVTALGVVPGVLPDGVRAVAGFLVSAGTWERWRSHLPVLVDRAAARHDRLVHDGVAQAAAVRALGLPDAAVLPPLVEACAGLVLSGGQVRRVAAGRQLDEAVARALAPLLARLAEAAFAAPEAADLEAAGLGSRELAAAASAGVVLRLPGNVVLPPDGAERAARMLTGLAQPFTLSDARRALGTTRRVVVPLLEHLDRLGVTIRLDAAHRVVRGVVTGPAAPAPADPGVDPGGRPAPPRAPASL